MPFILPESCHAVFSYPCKSGNYRKDKSDSIQHEAGYCLHHRIRCGDITRFKIGCKDYSYIVHSFAHIRKECGSDKYTCNECEYGSNVFDKTRAVKLLRNDYACNKQYHRYYRKYNYKCADICAS